MMLEQNFFTIKNVDRNVNSFAVNVIINKGHKVFEGHFPGNPTVPEVFTLQVIKDCAEYVLGKKFKYTELQNCKFTNVITPDDSNIVIEFDYIDGEPDVLKATVKNNDIVCVILKAKVKQIS